MAKNYAGMVSGMELQCKFCGEKFIKIHRHQRYCSKKCSDEKYTIYRKEYGKRYRESWDEETRKKYREYFRNYYHTVTKHGKESLRMGLIVPPRREIKKLWTIFREQRL